MTSATARSNARLKQAERERQNLLYNEWKKLLERNASPEEFLKLGGTKEQLDSFLWLHAS
jgi:hypothetical protein